MVFARSILKIDSIKGFNDGKMQGDFTCIDDVFERIICFCFKKAIIDDGFNSYSQLFKFIFTLWVFNIGNSNPIFISYCIELFEKNLGKKSIKDF